MIEVKWCMQNESNIYKENFKSLSSDTMSPCDKNSSCVWERTTSFDIIGISGIIKGDPEVLEARGKIARSWL